MDIKSAIEKLRFRLRRFRKFGDYRVKVPNGNYTVYYPTSISIGNLSYIKGYEKKFDSDNDPHWRLSKPWDQEDSSPDNVRFTADDILLVQPKGIDAKQAYLVSNFTIKYGTVRALIKTDEVPGSWSAFWLFGVNGMPEHDILEHYGALKNNQVSVTHHWGYSYDNNNKKSTLHNQRINKRFKPADDYTLYEIELSPYKVTYKINGIVVRALKTHLSSSDNRVLLSIGKKLEQCPDSTGVLARDAVMKVKWIEIFKIK